MRIFRVRVQHSKPGYTRVRLGLDGFTLLEVLVALVVVAVTAAVTTSSLLSVLRAEGVALRLEQAALLVQTIACREWLDLPQAEQLEEGGYTWSVGVQEAPAYDTEDFTWRVYTIFPEGRRLPVVNVAFAQ